jgi:nucleoside-diphosphate-sugar epimerase
VTISLVTGGAGYFGTELVKQLKANGAVVRVLDLNIPDAPIPGVEYLAGDIANLELCLEATRGVDTVYHNVAQVPLAKSGSQFSNVNVLGTENICEASRKSGVRCFVYTSSSAVYGIPKSLPVQNDDLPEPLEEYGYSKLHGEFIAKGLVGSGIEVKIIRPRTILGPGRLGIFSILFEWISKGLDIHILGQGNDPYQFIHSEDLAAGMIRASDLPGSFQLNLGALSYGTFRSDLQALCSYANTGSKVVSMNEDFFRSMMRLAIKLRILPFAPYQIQLYSRGMYFDSKENWTILDYSPKYSNISMLIDSYEWYKQNQNQVLETNKSHHQKPLKKLSIDFVTLLLMGKKILGLAFVKKRN